MKRNDLIWIEEINDNVGDKEYWRGIKGYNVKDVECNKDDYLNGFRNEKKEWNGNRRYWNRFSRGGNGGDEEGGGRKEERYNVDWRRNYDKSYFGYREYL